MDQIISLFAHLLALMSLAIVTKSTSSARWQFKCEIAQRNRVISISKFKLPCYLLLKVVFYVGLWKSNHWDYGNFHGKCKFLIPSNDEEGNFQRIIVVRDHHGATKNYIKQYL